MKTRTKIILLLSATVVLLITVLFIRHRTLEERYQTASRYVENGELAAAYDAFRTLGSYRDSGERLAQLTEREPSLAFRKAEKGGLVTFGRWEQDNDPANGPEPIEWIVLDQVNGRFLLLSRYCLDGGPYHDVSFAEITWENSALRARLNNEFFPTAFSEVEQQLIPAVRNRNDNQSNVGTEGGNTTNDRIFLLSEAEAVVYLNDELSQDSIGKALPTDYAKAHGVETDAEGYASWWLRSPGNYPYSAQFVDQQGKDYLSGAYNDIDYQFGIRPVIWVEIDGK